MKPMTRRRSLDRSILERLLLGRGVEKIAQECAVGKRRVREVREKAIAHGYLDLKGKGAGPTVAPLPPHPLFPDPVDGRSLRTSPQDEVLTERLEWIKDRLKAGWSPITVFEEIGDPSVGRSSFYRFLSRHSLHDMGKHYRSPTLITPIIHTPGEALILDWGKIRDVTDPASGRRRVLWGFVGVLGHSRYLMVRLVWTNDVPTTLAAIESMLQELGGVPRRLTSDNPKCFALEADEYDPLLNPALSRFAAHYSFLMECLPPADPQKKGKVERMMPFVRRLFEAYPKEFVSLEHAQEHINRRVAIANERRHGTTCQKPIQAYLEREVATLKALPPLAYEREEVAYPTVRKDGHVRFANKYYALADEHIGKDVVVIATESQIAIYDRGRLLELYDRIIDPNTTHATKDHLSKPWQKIEEQNAGLLALASKIGPHAEEFVRATLSRGEGFVDTRIIWGFLSLDKTYSRDSINQAAGIALEMNQLSSRLVERLIKLTHEKPIPAEKVVTKTPGTQVKSAKFVRPMSVYTDRLKGAANASTQTL
jgi:hypothetical protein